MSTSTLYFKRLPREEVIQLALLFLDSIDASGVCIKQLAGYDDANYHITALKETGLPSEQFVLKIHCEEGSSNVEYLEAQSASMLHLLAQGVMTTEPMPTKADPCKFVALQTISEQQQQQQDTQQQQQQQQHAVRLLRFVPGSIISKQCLLSTALLQSWGSFMARVSQGLSSVVAPALQLQHPWHMHSAADVVRQRAAIPDLPLIEQQRCWLVAAAAELQAMSEQIGTQLPCQVCHTDGNEANLLTDQDRQQVVAILDFGDACVCWRVVEVAVAMAYAGLVAADYQLAHSSTSSGSSTDETTAKGAVTGLSEAGEQQGEVLEQPAHLVSAGGSAAPSFWEAMQQVLAGYQSLVSLSSAELQAVPTLIKGRIALSLVNGVYGVLQEPNNAQYLLTTQRPGWHVLEQLSTLSPEQILQQLLAGL